MLRILLRLAIAVACVLPAATATDAETIEMSFDAVIERLSRVETLRGRYNQIREIPALARPLESSGRFIVSELGLYWEQQEPFRTVIVADTDRLSQAVANEPMVTVSAAEQPIVVGVAQVFMGIFRGQSAAIDRYFEVHFESTSDAWSMTLTPKGFPLSEAVEDIVVDGRELIERLTVRGRAGDRLAMDLVELERAPQTLRAEERALYTR